MKPVRIGVLTPSSNTVLEPLTAAMLAGLPDVSAHFSRFPVTEIALSATALAQFDPAPILRAAELLAHARVDAIVWSGTSSGWLGLQADHELCTRITAATGIAATTSMLALDRLLERIGARRLGFVTPYLDAVQDRIVANYAGRGWTCVAERHCGLQENFSFSEVSAADIATMTREVAAFQPDAIAVICTNLRAAPLVAGLEAELGLPILDTVATGVWGGLVLAGAAPSLVAGWGRLFSLAIP